MALPKKGLRKLEYEGVQYGWKVRQKPTYDQAVFESSMTVAMQNMETDTPKVLHVKLNVFRPDNWLSPCDFHITPQIIKQILSKAIEIGWESDAGGGAYELEHSVTVNE